MWLPEQLGEMGDELAGVEVPLEQLAPGGAISGAVTSIGHCTASFVSGDGLLLTNAHCIRDMLQQASEGDEDLVTDGFYAASRDDERSGGPQARLYVLEEMVDVTDEVLADVKRKTGDEERFRSVEEAKARLAASCEEGMRCDVAVFDGGGRYVLVKRAELRDVRLAYVPPDALAMFGGEEDNWMWPRHTADVALVRAYVGPDGGPAAYAEDNVPYEPATHLPMAAEGPGSGDLVMLLGYPYTTARYRTASELGHARDVRYTEGIELFAELMGVFKERAKDSPDAHRRVNGAMFTLSNAGKSYQGMLDNFLSQGLVEAKTAQEAALRTWIYEERKREKRYGPALQELDRVLAEQQATASRDRLVSLTRWYPQLLRATRTAYRLSVERRKPEAERRAGFQPRDEQGLADGLAQLDKTLYLRADMDVMRVLLTRSQALPADQRIPPFDAWLAEVGGIEAGLTALFTRPQLAETSARMALLEQSSAELEASSDPWVQLAVALEQWQDTLQAEEDAAAGALTRLRPLYMEALRAYAGGPVYSDANGTLRVSVGKVAGYSPAEAVMYADGTTLSGLLEKEGPAPFALPAAVRSRAEQDLGVPVNFLSTLDNTGGNSGSPTLNASGEVVGVVFDRNYEGMAADWHYDPEVTRSIHVDVELLYWMLAELAGDERLLGELGVR